MPDRRQGDVVADIKAAVDPAAYDLTRAEGRADFDDALRDELAKIDDERLRMHAAEMIRDWRAGLFGTEIRKGTAR
jgi:hypothetical protein